MDWSELRRSRRRIGPIGIDFDSDCIHLAQLEARNGEVRVRAAATVKYDGDLDALLSERQVLRRLFADPLRRGGFRGRRVVTHVRSEELRLMVLNYDLAPGTSEPAQILELTRERMRSDLDEHVVDFVPIRTSGDQTGERSALVAVAPEAPVILHLERLRHAGLRVEALEIAPVAVRRLIAAVGGAGVKDLVLVVRMRNRSTELTLLSGRRLLLYRQIEVGLESIFADVSKALDCDEATACDLLASYGVDGNSRTGGDPFVFGSDDPFEAGLGEIVSTLRDTLRPSLRAIVEQAHKAVSYAAFQTRGTSLERVYLLEGTRSCPGLDGLLAEMLQLPVEPFQPGRNLKPLSDRRPAPVRPSHAVALGFALRGLDDV